VSVDRDLFTASVSAKLQTFFSSKLAVIDALAVSAENAHGRNKSIQPAVQWPDSDTPTNKHTELLRYSSAFKTEVDMSQGWVKVPAEAPRDGVPLRQDIAWSQNLNSEWNTNRAVDTDIRWQYIGTSTGLFLMSPGKEWSTNHQGLLPDFDPRFRPWYVGAISGPKDVAIVMDCSLSMTESGSWSTAVKAANLLLDTLTANDHVAVVCSAKSHWPHETFSSTANVFAETHSVGCMNNKMLPATASIVNDFKSRLDAYVKGATDFASGINLASQIMNAQGREACQRIMVYITGGEDGDEVRCDHGLLTQDGHEPGPLCEASFKKGYNAAAAAMRAESL